MDVEVRELQDNLDRYLADVQSGHIVTITEHAKPVVLIVPIEHPTRPEQVRAEVHTQPACQPKAPRPKRFTALAR
ncbi:type II toxin-antitoxin system Phd/YefM family antitoxin [Nocardia vaccinii]|uniref:type II toxin-antitoxin system Phd/YefM family antitoxin n=1 Tax=Nocardia vaccinii TaxID=1822 RepID=UPI000A059552|nr:type II toxin-antitoxin system prevent-host-death family antitoxin [Nocardia vaccinii]